MQGLTEITIGKSGKHTAIKDPRNFDISNYLSKVSIIVPANHDWTSIKKTEWGIFGNDKLNNCTCAAAGHMIKCWTANATTEFEIKEDDILATYAKISGYDAATGKNDDGAYVLDALKYWRKNGVGQHKIKAFATVPLDNKEIVKASIYIFGGIYVGLQLPKSIVGQKIWSVIPGKLTGDKEPWSWGGHAVTILAYDETHLTCVTCGIEQKMTWEFWETYNDEAYAIITEDFFNGDITPVGLNLKAMESDLMNLTRQKITLTKQLQAKT